MFLCSVKNLFLWDFLVLFSSPIFIWTFSFFYLYCLWLQFLFIPNCFSSMWSCVMNGIMTSIFWEFTRAYLLWSLQFLSPDCLHYYWLWQNFSQVLKLTCCTFSEYLLAMWGRSCYQIWQVSDAFLCSPHMEVGNL